MDNSIDVVGVINRKISIRRIIFEEMKLGFFKFFIKFLKKFIKPMLQSFFKKKLKHTKSMNSNTKSFLVDDFNDLNSVEIIKGLKPDLIVFTGGGICSTRPVRNSQYRCFKSYRGFYPI